MNSDLTKQIQSSIDDMCQCTLPCYTLRGSIDLCDPQSNCAIYTGRILGSDTASATQVFKMVEDWLAIQNGSLLNGTLTVDPDCPLRRLSPRDTPCSTPAADSNASPPSNGESSDLLMLLVISLAGGLLTTLICCTVIVCAVCSVCRSRVKKEDLLKSPMYAQPLVAQSDQRHYSIVVQGNPSYDKVRSHPNGELQEVTVANNDSAGSHQQSEDTQQVTQTTTRPANALGSTSSAYVDYSPSSLNYWNEDDNIFHSNRSATYLSITHTQ